MEKVVSPVDKEILVAELTKNKLLRLTNNKSNEIYIITDEDSPNVMQEIGRLREVTFRDAGGGTGKSLDIDEYDLGKDGFKQMIVWDPEEQQIVGGYRYIDCSTLPVVDGVVASPTSRLFSYSKKFIDEYLPHTIELGRSFVQPLYQPTYNLKRGLFALNNLWDGIGALIVEHAKIKYLFGKVTMYPHFERLARDLILYFMQKYFPDNDALIFPKKPLVIETDPKTLDSYFKGNHYDEDYKILVKNVRKQGENIPPLISAYMSLSSTMRTFGTSLNDHFGNVEETGILVTIKDIYHKKKAKHVNSYVRPTFD